MYFGDVHKIEIPWSGKKSTCSARNDPLWCLCVNFFNCDKIPPWTTQMTTIIISSNSSFREDQNRPKDHLIGQTEFKLWIIVFTHVLWSGSSLTTWVTSWVSLNPNWTLRTAYKRKRPQTHLDTLKLCFYSSTLSWHRFIDISPHWIRDHRRWVHSEWGYFRSWSLA